MGKTGFEVSEVGLGCWQLGGDFGPIEDEKAKSVLAAATEAGIDFFDTADVYGDGRSEALVGEHAASLPRRPVLATKVGRTADLYPDAYGRDGVRDHLKQSADRLRVDALDLVQLHCVPPEVLRGGDLFEVMNEAQADGLVRAWGTSVETIEEGMVCLDEPGCASIQLIFNIFRQDAADELLPRAKEQDVGIIVRLPLASGLLTGKFSRDTHFAPTDHRNYNRNGEAFSVGETFSGIPFDTGLDLVDKVQAALPDHDGSLAQVAIRWCLDHDAVSSVIAGASKPAQARANAAASEMPALSPEVHDELRKLYDAEVKPAIRVPV
nr:aldo/keto reductase [Parvularcula dongshanensis]